MQFLKLKYLPAMNPIAYFPKAQEKLFIVPKIPIS